MTKRLGSSNRRRGRKSKREVEDRLGDIPRSDIDAAVAEAFDAAKPTPESSSAASPEIATSDASVFEETKAKAAISDRGHNESAASIPQSEINQEPIPARMLNEFVYCPRLFYYEFVEGVFVHSADTLRGAAIHTRVDSGSGAMPPAEGAKSETEEPEVIHSRSVSLGSDRIGVTAKIDLVEVRAAQTVDASNEPDLFSKAEVCPVDYKAGAPREGEEGKELWDADKMQLGLQCLLLRDNGYICNEGIIYYRATKQRVRLLITPELEKWVVEKIHDARKCAAGTIPPPLFDSPKCPRCSLVTVCLPDETRMLAQRTTSDQPLVTNRESGAGEPRRLIAARDDTRALYLNTPGLFVGRSGEVLQVKEKKELVQEVRINDLSHVALFGNVQISTAAVQALCEADVPVTYFSMGG